jgi:diguanylate cyclase (GGDEF)-like protein
MFRSALAALSGLLFALCSTSVDAACPAIEAEATSIAALRDTDPARGVSRGEIALEQARTATPPCAIGEAMVLSAIGNNLHILGRNNEAAERYRQALEILPTDATPAQVATVHRGAGVALAEIESYEPALEHYLIALSASRDAGDVLEAAKTAGNIGNLYNALGQLDRSREYHTQALREFEAVDFKPGIAGTLINLGALSAKFASAAQEAGDVAEERRENEDLREHNERALALFTELGNERGIAYASSNIGLALERMGDPAQSLVHLERALMLRRQIGDVHGEINSHSTMAGTLIRLDRFDEARSHLDRADALVPDDNFGLALAIAQPRVDLAEARGDFREALRWQREVTRLHSAMSSEDNNARVADLQSRFDSDQQAREIALLRSDAEVRSLELERQHTLQKVGLIISALVAVLIAVLYSRLRLGRITARELQRAARTDPVTELANRRFMIERIEHEIQRVRRSGRPFTLLMIDVDRFKAINDDHGHGIGDAVLIGIGRRMTGHLRAQDTLARWGGEEFLALLPDTDGAGGLVAAEKLRAAVTSEPLSINDLRIALSVTIGVADYGAGMSVDDCVRAADQAMYAGKREGRDRSVLHRSGSTLSPVT